MKDETKQEISIILDLLKSNLIQNGVSMATDKKGNLIFVIQPLMLKAIARNLTDLELILTI